MTFEVEQTKSLIDKEGNQTPTHEHNETLSNSCFRVKKRLKINHLRRGTFISFFVSTDAQMYQEHNVIGISTTEYPQCANQI